MRVHGLSMSSFVVFLLDTNFHGRSEKGQVWTTLNPFGPDPNSEKAGKGMLQRENPASGLFLILR